MQCNVFAMLQITYGGLLSRSFVTVGHGQQNNASETPQQLAPPVTPTPHPGRERHQRWVATFQKELESSTDKVSTYFWKQKKGRGV